MKPRIPANPHLMGGLLLVTTALSLQAQTLTLTEFDDPAAVNPNLVPITSATVTAPVAGSINGNLTLPLVVSGSLNGNAAFDVGDTYIATFDATIVANSSDPAPIPWDNGASLAFGVHDAAAQNAVGFTLDLRGIAPAVDGRFRTGFDLAVTGGGNFGHNSPTSGSFENGQVAAERLTNIDDTVSLLFAVTKTASDETGDTLELRAQFGETPGIAVQTIIAGNGVSIDALTNFVVRANALAGEQTADIQIDNFDSRIVEADTLIWFQDGSVQGRSLSRTATENTGASTLELVTVGEGMPNRSFSVGERATMSFTLAVSENTAAPNPIPWINNQSILISLIDATSEDAVGIDFSLTGTPMARVGYDLIATSGGNFSLTGGTSGAFVTGTEITETFQQNGDSANLTLIVDKISSDDLGDELVLSLQWGNTVAMPVQTVATSEGLRIENLSRYGLRLNGIAAGTDTALVTVSNFDLVVSAIPSPVTTPLLITSIVVNDDQSVNLTWNSQPDLSYAVDLTATLLAGSFVEQTGSIPSGGEVTTFLVPAAAVSAAAVNGRLFFQVREE